MTSRVEMPALGENVTEGLITRWLRQVGDTVDKDEPLLEVAADKVDTEIPAPFAGTVEQLLAEENSTVSVGDPLAVITPIAASQSPTVPGPQVVPALSESAPEPAKAAPVPGPNIASAQPATAPEPDEANTPPKLMPSGSASRVEKMSRLRQTIAKRMVESLQTSAQLTTVVEADVTKLARLRTRSKDEFHRRTGTKLSFLPFFAKAIVEALNEYPMFNASVSPDHTEVIYHASRNLGIAVDTPRGLLVPVIRDANGLSVSGIALAIADLADRTRNGKISADELAGGTFTLTNTGSRGALFDTPIINQPQSGIVGTGAVVDRVIPLPDGLGGHSFAVRSMVYLSVSYDHRLVDGADAARFLTTIKSRVEHADFDTEL